MSLDVPADLLARAESGPVDDAEFVDCVRTSLPYAWQVISQVATAAPGTPEGFADHEVPPPSEAERGQLLRALASDAIRGGLERHFGVKLAFQNCHRVAAFTPARVDGDRYRAFISPRSSAEVGGPLRQHVLDPHPVGGVDRKLAQPLRFHPLGALGQVPVHRPRAEADPEPGGAAHPDQVADLDPDTGQFPDDPDHPVGGLLPDQQRPTGQREAGPGAHHQHETGVVHHDGAQFDGGQFDGGLAHFGSGVPGLGDGIARHAIRSTEKQRGQATRSR
jgi:hypothetical protein